MYNEFDDKFSFINRSIYTSLVNVVMRDWLNINLN